jgi:hypothetical protein
MVTSNHVHLLIKATGQPMHKPVPILPVVQSLRSVQNVAELIETDHLHRYLVYFDLNMVRAGVVEHPVNWLNSGYREIQQPPKRYAVIDLYGLLGLVRLFKTGRFSTSSSPMDRGSSSAKVSASRRALVGSRCGWQSRFRREGQKRARNKSTAS